MKLILDNVDLRHKNLILEMAKSLQFKVREIELTEKEEDMALSIAIEEGKTKGRATPEEQAAFEKWLKT